MGQINVRFLKHCKTKAQLWPFFQREVGRVLYFNYLLSLNGNVNHCIYERGENAFRNGITAGVYFSRRPCRPRANKRLLRLFNCSSFLNLGKVFTARTGKPSRPLFHIFDVYKLSQNQSPPGYFD